ncbi:hypothetical protein F4778DRAFT_775917 [Xylariomycetidae sp. FL2044]|nr:hypothetical protein F4778DRAFT_775917 [Xylariomycetidae sp. FL2044]
MPPRPPLPVAVRHLSPRTNHARIKPIAATYPQRHQQKRPFFSHLTSSSEPQTLTAHRTLPYSAASLYDLIADIDSYPTFLPYCKSARVTSWTDPSPYPSSSSSSSPSSDPSPTSNPPARRWPTSADLTAGWGGLEETYTSRLFCIPGQIVEAISGDDAQVSTEIPASLLREHGLYSQATTKPLPPGGQRGGGGGGGGTVFKSLITRWTITPNEARTRADRFQTEWTDVGLSIKFRFANPLYGAVSAAVADKVAPLMVEAFVKQADRVLGSRSSPSARERREVEGGGG